MTIEISGQGLIHRQTMPVTEALNASAMTPPVVPEQEESGSIDASGRIKVHLSPMGKDLSLTSQQAQKKVATRTSMTAPCLTASRTYLNVSAT